MSKLSEKLKECSMIAAVRNNIEFEFALKADVKAISLLKTTINDFRSRVDGVHRSGKMCFLYVDNIEGLVPGVASVEFVLKTVKPEGIISSDKDVVMHCRSMGILGIYRVALLDNTDVDGSITLINRIRPDGVEVLPGMMPEVISLLRNKTSTAIIAGGLMLQEQDVQNALKSGAVAVNSTNSNLWLDK